jgi:hypothetical protein
VLDGWVAAGVLPAAHPVAARLRARAAASGTAVALFIDVLLVICADCGKATMREQ